MNAPWARVALYAALGVLYLLHNDLWLWHDGTPVFGLPAGLTYHVLYCLATAALMALLVRYAWPSDLAAADQAREERHPEGGQLSQ